MYDATGRVQNSHFEIIKSVMRQKCPVNTLIKPTNMLFEFDTTSDISSSHSEGVRDAITTLRSTVTSLTNHTEDEVRLLRSQVNAGSAALGRLEQAQASRAPIIDRTLVRSTASPETPNLLVLVSIVSPRLSQQQHFSIRFSTDCAENTAVLYFKCCGIFEENDKEINVLETTLEGRQSYLLEGTISHAYTGLDCVLTGFPFISSQHLALSEINTLELYVKSSHDAAVVVAETTLYAVEKVIWDLI